MLQGNVTDNKGSVILIQKFDGTILLSIKNNKIMNGKNIIYF